MPMKLRTSKTQALEKAKVLSNLLDLELLGTEALATINNQYKRLLEEKEISSSQNSFISIFGLNTKFFYSVTLVCESHGFTEFGIAYIEQQEEKFILKRFRPFYMIENGATIVVKKIRPIICDRESYVLASSYAPTTFVEVLTESNSIITCESPHLPTSVVVDKNSVLGRHDGNLESIPIESLVDEETARNSIIQYKNNLSLKSSKVDVKRLTTNDLQLNARKSAPERKGVIYYDESDDCLKYYDGTIWRRLMWQKDSL
jgi:hypothetical protein